MLSRVVAVKAPCTHNRRRVTGSSGMRREGGESEPQRPNMYRHLFYSAVLLLVVMMCCGSSAASNEKTLSDSELSTRKLFHWKDTTDKGTVNLLFFPSLVELNGDVFAVAEALFTRGVEGVFTGIASELLTLTDKQTSKELDKTKLKTQVLGECSSGKEECPNQAVDDSVSESGAQALVSKPTTVVHGSDIYMLAGTYNLDGVAAAGEDITDEWGLLLARGNVSIVEDGRNKRIYWTDVDALPITSNTEQYGYVTAPLGSGGSGVKMEDGTLVFPMEGEVYRTGEADEENTAEGGYTVSLFIYFPDNNSWKLSKGMSAHGCSDPSVVNWEKDKLMMMTACDGGRQRVYESGDKGDSWTEALGTLSRVWGNDEGNEWGVRSGFTTAKIGDNRDVMLVTLPVYSSKDGNGKGELHLWLTDNTHIVDIGPVSEEDDDVTTSFLLYKSAESNDNNGEKLIALYEKKKKVNHELSHDMVTVRLTVQLEKVKEVLTTWKKVDERVSQLCTTLLAGKVALTEIACTTGKITDGLVGFLSGNFSENTWRDEYLGVNATVNNKGRAKKTTDGVTFRGAWAEWPVGSQGQNQLYHFANYNFTLVATVSVDGEPTEYTPIPLLGAKMAGVENNPVLLGLSYNGGGKWQLLCGDETNKEISSTWKRGTKHQVAIVLRNGTHGSAYVDGVRVGEDAQCQLENTDSEGISHFYIGGDGGIADNTESREGVFVTVTNVLLYNRPLTFSGGNAEVEEVTDSPSAEPASPFVARNQNAAPPATILPEAPVEQMTLQQPQHEGKGQNATAEESATTQEVPATTSQGSVAKAAASNSHAAGEARGDGGTVRESGLLPSLLLLLGLWGFAAL
ncbi:putative trans-sialidase, Group VI [Trypanosoma cruzi]|uniref:Trans-sialidase, putative n=2 Tax=Trypanosoma cruzi TaxID=5693 RepID=Q4DPD2_TRYCC|nr:trans-sialidase, putative [Trypanosoma cruzi]EAN94382.1 trans-sialidase, putative [Trypanosoma cruzi]PWV06152.1 putative trans-sialidase, Group VI [Trypanosoma cruzi]|eukprot:XP_816233.1 trans-sialidase [Trypanosoma cruzi strain CL Brener]